MTGPARCSTRAANSSPRGRPSRLRRALSLDCCPPARYTPGSSVLLSSGRLRLPADHVLSGVSLALTRTRRPDEVALVLSLRSDNPLDGEECRVGSAAYFRL